MASFSDIRRFTEIDSTNRWMREAAASGDATHGCVAIADLQTAGRGRLDRRWVAPAKSALLMSVLVDAGAVGLSTERWPMISFCMAYAVQEVANTACGAGTHGTRPVTLKWPNDVIVPGGNNASAGSAAGSTAGSTAGAGSPVAYRKLAGILVEASAGRLVVGVGVNLVRPDEVDSTLGVAATPVWLGELTDSSIDRDDFAAGVLESFSSCLDTLVRSADELVALYRSVLSTIGWVVTIESGGLTWSGEAVDIDGLGRLVVVNGSGRHHVDASEVVHVRPVG